MIRSRRRLDQANVAVGVGVPLARLVLEDELTARLGHDSEFLDGTEELERVANPKLDRVEHGERHSRRLLQEIGHDAPDLSERVRSP